MFEPARGQRTGRGGEEQEEEGKKKEEEQEKEEEDKAEESWDRCKKIFDILDLSSLFQLLVVIARESLGQFNLNGNRR